LRRVLVFGVVETSPSHSGRRSPMDLQISSGHRSNNQ